MRVRLLHFIPDDKFVDYTIDALKSYSDVESTWCMYNRSCKDEIKWHKHVECIEFTPYGSKRLEEILRECREGAYDGIWFHSLPDHVGYFARNCGATKKVFISWGHDIYGMMWYRDYLPDTSRFLRSTMCRPTLKKKLGKPLRTIQHWIATNPFVPMDRSVRTIIKCFDYVAPVLNEDYEIFRTRYPYSRMPELVEFQYGYWSAFAEFKPLTSPGNILLNNSATATGNHVDVFKKLMSIGVDSDVIVPLNYGDGEPYLGFVIKNGREILGERFKPMLDFLPTDVYFKAISCCTNMVMGHLRQQALGNIAYGLMTGMKVFLWKDSPVYSQFSRMGFSLFTLDKVKKEDFEQVLPESEQRKNAELLLRYFGKPAMDRKLRALIDAMMKRG